MEDWYFANIDYPIYNSNKNKMDDHLGGLYVPHVTQRRRSLPRINFTHDVLEFEGKKKHVVPCCQGLLYANCTFSFTLLEKEDHFPLSLVGMSLSFPR